MIEPTQHGVAPKFVVNAGELRWTIELIEREFGHKWLSRKASQSHSKHPVPLAWKEAVDLRNRMAKGHKASTISDRIALLLDIARDFDVICSLPNYDTAIRPRLKDPDFGHVRYEAQVAAFAVRRSYRVGFVVPSTNPGVSTPDLRISHGNQTFFAECKRKDAYEIAAVEQAVWPDLQEKILGVLQDLNADYEVIVVALGPFRNGDTERILEGVRAAVAKGYEGGPLTRKGTDHAIYLRRLPLPPPSPNPGMHLVPGEARRGERYMDVFRGEDDLFYVRSNRGAWLYTIDCHRLATIVYSFNAARRQLPSGDAGVIYVDLDISHVEDRDLKLYFDSAGSALRHIFSPTANTRVAAVVLTAVTLFMPAINESGATTWEPHIGSIVIRNPFNPTAAKLSIPPDNPQG